ncbi:Oxidoreductase, molybdopterin-binding domain-containing protein [Parachaetomium inaequale]|uniref:Nitrate reductase [NADPH] n=1 Tax=Parachaetomium inaequale TaxID=2588326 RepID=A0AAN6P9P3_9PEZI|nr:Oxidoreductase, molybdopterin-binding domain-containing protein [Parachaetomium inaequale]
MATRTPIHTATRALRQFARRDAPELAVCRLTQPLPRSLHTSGRRASNDTARVPHPKAPTGRRPPFQARAAPLSLLVGGGLAASFLAYSQLGEDGPRLQDAAPTSTDDRDPSLPRFRLADIRKHDASSSEPWVTLEDKVYDITDWIAAHPGGDVILRAAGASIEPYWNIFTIHKAPHVREILQQYLIGFIDAADLGPDGLPAAETIEDPFVDDPIRDPRLITHTAKPRNAEPPNEELDRTFRTPNELFYVRHHMWVPVVDEAKADEHLLSIELPDGETKQYTLEDLKTRFPTHRVTAVLQCSGNRRNDMTRHAGKTNGLQWGVGAISNAEWEGVRLSDILVDAGLKVLDATLPTRKGNSASPSDDQVDANALHVQFTGLEAYGASIPLAKALDPRGDVLLAFGMNGETLPRDHGFPLRAVVPGHVAARSVKWLSKIVISDEESTSQWQRRDYKSFGPNEGANPDWDRAVSIQEMPVTSAITGVWVGDCVRRGRVPWMGSSSTPSNPHQTTTQNSSSRILDMAAVPKKIGFTPEPSPATTTPCPPTTPPDEPIAVQGYAYSGGGRAITRVDVSLDGGKTWDQAELVNDSQNKCTGNKSWAWTRWRYVGALPILTLPTTTFPQTSPTAERGSGCHDGASSKTKPKHCTTLIVKATDDAYNTQPESHRGIYNVRGNLATAWHRVKICPRCTGTGDGGVGEGKGKGLTWSTGETYGCGFRKEAEEVREGMRRQGVVGASSDGNAGSAEGGK